MMIRKIEEGWGFWVGKLYKKRVKKKDDEVVVVANMKLCKVFY